VAALLMLIDPISHLTTNFNEFQQGQASLRRLRAIEQEPVEPPDRPGALPLGPVRGELRLEDVHFGYDPAQPVLRGIDLLVQPGQVVALVGPSGAGKSTLFSLLLRFNTAQSGRVLLDGTDLADLRARDLRRAVALVPQQSSVFSGTVAEAIAFGRPASRSEIEAAARLANASGFIEALPGGYDNRLEERGSNLSGGQLQRLAIARAVLGNPAVMLLDEATSALDAEAEDAVQRGLEQAMAGRSVLVIAHRLATVQGADRILVLDGGRIVEQGDHSALMARGGRYRELCERQLIRLEG
jgi:ATP-binding cassette subfamily B protein